MQLGDYEIYIFAENRWRIDGGAMFGVVPKVIWGKLVESDEFNRVKLDTNILLLKSDKGNIIVDSGMGDTLTDRQKKIYGINNDSTLEESLNSFGLKPEDIDMVILTHLHLDHSGGTVKLDKERKKIPTFPNARHVVQKKEFEDAINPDERTAATYIPENFLMLKEKSLLDLVDGEKEILQGIKVLPTGGHSNGHQVVLIQSPGETILCPGDIIPTRNHLKIPYVASVDTHPLETMKVKKKFIKKAIDDGWMIAFDHDLDLKLCKLKKVNHTFELSKIEA
jgi:glyoxylase-like metal-dependent hydrolase (beta-lactamase superfamily II)